MSIRILLTKSEGINIIQKHTRDSYININELGEPGYDICDPEYWDGAAKMVAELTPEEVKQVFDTIREILEARL